ncbi:F-box protein At5g62510-like [Lycium ferocissimum]|uniref:F-box protein At5g62510-like n=1 Tax=Lycium ferocissimum TaxID=112874 RepID=UPI00281558BE|nr:F-box protein At5g62510-like [Lycium ferocissimum]
MGFDPQEKTYKVLITVKEYSRSMSTKNWVFTLGTDKSWREIIRITDSVVRSKNAICISGFIYMWSYDEGNLSIVTFDVKNENFRTITFWNSSNHIEDSYNIRGNETRKEEWEKHIIQFPLECRRFCSCWDEEILFTKKTESGQFICLCYDVMKKRWRKLEIQGLPGTILNDSYSYSETLFLVEKLCNSA